MKAVIGLLVLLVTICCAAAASQIHFNDQQSGDRQLQVDRYTGYKTSATMEEVNPLLVITQINFPSQVKTVHDAIEHALYRSGYRVDWQQSTQASDIFSELEIPIVHRKLNLMTLKDALSTLVGSAWRIYIDSVNRKLIIQLHDDVPWQIAMHSKMQDAYPAPQRASVALAQPAQSDNDVLAATATPNPRPEGKGVPLKQSTHNGSRVYPNASVALAQPAPSDNDGLTTTATPGALPESKGVPLTQPTHNESRVYPNASVALAQPAQADSDVLTATATPGELPESKGAPLKQPTHNKSRAYPNASLALAQPAPPDNDGLAATAMPGALPESKDSSLKQPTHNGSRIYPNASVALAQLAPPDNDVLTATTTPGALPESKGVPLKQPTHNGSRIYPNASVVPAEPYELSWQPTASVDFVDRKIPSWNIDSSDAVPHVGLVQYMPTPQYVQSDESKASTINQPPADKNDANNNHNNLWSVEPLIKAKEGIGSLDEAVIVHYSSISVKELIEILIPDGWAVHYEVSDAILKQKMVSHAESSRRSALLSLFKELNLKALFYPGQAVVLVAEKEPRSLSSSNFSQFEPAKPADKQVVDRTSESLPDNPVPSASQPQVNTILENAKMIKGIMHKMTPVAK